MKLQLDITPEQMAALRQALQLTATEIEAIATATVRQLAKAKLKGPATYTVREFAAAARLSTSHVHALIREGRIEATKPDGRGDKRITHEAAAKFLAGASNGNAG